MTAIVVKDLVKRFGRFTAVDTISFEAAPGQVTALLGPNGAGNPVTVLRHSSQARRADCRSPWSEVTFSDAPHGHRHTAPARGPRRAAHSMIR